jgi:hypothetical protein
VLFALRASKISYTLVFLSIYSLKSDYHRANDEVPLARGLMDANLPVIPELSVLKDRSANGMRFQVAKSAELLSAE